MTAHPTTGGDLPPRVPEGSPEGRRFFVEFDTAEACPLDFLDNPEVVLFFASWAFSIRFGGAHELAQAALRLQRRHKVDLKAITRYADRNIEDEGDRRELERAWQDPAPLALCCRAVAGAIESRVDDELNAFVAGYEHLPPRLHELAAMCDWGEAQGARVRLSFLLD